MQALLKLFEALGEVGEVAGIAQKAQDALEHREFETAAELLELIMIKGHEREYLRNLPETEDSKHLGELMKIPRKCIMGKVEETDINLDEFDTDFSYTSPGSPAEAWYGVSEDISPESLMLVEQLFAAGDKERAGRLLKSMQDAGALSEWKRAMVGITAALERLIVTPELTPVFQENYWRKWMERTVKEIRENVSLKGEEASGIEERIAGIRDYGEGAIRNHKQYVHSKQENIRKTALEYLNGLKDLQELVARIEKKVVGENVSAE